MKKFTLTLIFALFFSLEAAQYQLIDLGLLNYKESDATSINNQGQVCGLYTANEKRHLFVWDTHKLTPLQARTLSNPVINNQGQIFGSMLTRVVDGMWEIDQEIVFKWAPPSNAKSLGYPASQKSAPFNILKRCVAWDANDHQQVLIMNQELLQTGEKPSLGETSHKVWIYDQGVFKMIENPQFSAGLKINNQSQILGVFFDGEITTRFKKRKKLAAAIYDLTENTARLLPFPSESFGTDINDQGQVTGIYFNTLKNDTQGFLFDPSADLVSIDNFVPKALNNHGQIVGKFLSGDKKDKPAIWDNGALLDLSTITNLVDDQGHTWESLDFLADINDLGAIIGRGKYQGANHGFLLLPL